MTEGGFDSVTVGLIEFVSLGLRDGVTVGVSDGEELGSTVGIAEVFEGKIVGRGDGGGVVGEKEGA